MVLKVLGVIGAVLLTFSPFMPWVEIADGPYSTSSVGGFRFVEGKIILALGLVTIVLVLITLIKPSLIDRRYAIGTALFVFVAQLLVRFRSETFLNWARAHYSPNGLSTTVTFRSGNGLLAMPIAAVCVLIFVRIYARTAVPGSIPAADAGT